MKARIKATGEIKDVIAGDIYLEGMGGRSLGINEVEFEGGFDKTDWEALRNQAAIAAMQAIVSNRGIPSDEAVVVTAVELADALIKELKGE